MIQPKSVAVLLAIAALVEPSWAQLTQRVSLGLGGVEADNWSSNVAMTPDGRFLAFVSAATNMTAGSGNNLVNVFVRDRTTGLDDWVNVGLPGLPGMTGAYYPAISADGRFVSFVSNAWDLVLGDTNGKSDIFVRDRQLGTTERVSVDSSGGQADMDSYYAAISSDGRYVAFGSYATNLVSGDTNGQFDIFVHDRQLGTTERVSVASGGIEAHPGVAFDPHVAISSDGRFVAFASDAADLVLGDTNGLVDVFVHDRQLNTTERVNVDSAGVQANGHSEESFVSLSSDGRFVAFQSVATNLVPGDTNGKMDVFVHDRQTGATERISVDSSGAEANDNSFAAALSGDGRCVAYGTWATNLVPGDTNAVEDILVRDRLNGTTERMSVDSNGLQSNARSRFPALSADGRFVAFESDASDLVAGDTNGDNDVFLHDRNPSGFLSLCDAGVGGVVSCPCSNPASGLGRGCDNSSATGGAVLSASGSAYLTGDSLVFTTSAEKPTAASILLQGGTLLVNGIVFGQGVRCAGQPFRRLYIKAAVSGSVSAPNFSVGDPTISARSSTLGAPIQPGESRYYLVYYRDPIVLGGCPSSSGFNATQTGSVTWWL